MPLRFRYTINSAGREYMEKLDFEAPTMDFKDWMVLAPEGALLKGLERLYPNPSLLRQILLAIPEEERWPKEVLVPAIHRLVSKGYVDYEAEVHG